MAYVNALRSTPLIPVPIIEKAEKGGDLTHLVAFVAVGLFFSVLCYALTPPEWLPESAAALAPEMQAATGLNADQIEIAAGLPSAE